ncbi:MAG: N-acetyltransferase [Dokdonella sp.]
MTDAVPSAITHDVESRHLLKVVDGYRCVLDYRLTGTTMTITHTGVPTAVSGRGIAGELVRAAAHAARAAGWKIVPACSYAETYFNRDHSFADVIVEA